jgi:hypothetical protein
MNPSEKKRSIHQTNLILERYSEPKVITLPPFEMLVKKPYSFQTISFDND